MKIPANLPLPILKDVHSFLDAYNYILDREFAAAKQILYPDYWKIGIGILGYGAEYVRFILYPVKFQEDQTLVKEVKENEREQLDKQITEGNVLMIASLRLHQSDDFYIAYATTYWKTPFCALSASIIPMADEFVAHEYLVSFIDRYNVYLNMEKSDAYSLTDLQYKLYSVLPMLVRSEHSFGDHVTHCTHNIDGYAHWNKPSPYHQKAIARSIERLDKNVVSKVRVTVVSELYNIDLIHFYIHWLQRNGKQQAKRQYLPGQFDETICGVDFWKTWNKDVLWTNVQRFFAKFHELYNVYTDEFLVLDDCITKSPQ